MKYVFFFGIFSFFTTIIYFDCFEILTSIFSNLCFWFTIMVFLIFLRRDNLIFTFTLKSTNIEKKNSQKKCKKSEKKLQPGPRRQSLYNHDCDFFVALQKEEHLQLLGRPNFSAPKFKNASDMYICQIKALKFRK